MSGGSEPAVAERDVPQLEVPREAGVDRPCHRRPRVADPGPAPRDTGARRPDGSCRPRRPGASRRGRRAAPAAPGSWPSTSGTRRASRWSARPPSPGRPPSVRIAAVLSPASMVGSTAIDCVSSPARCWLFTTRAWKPAQCAKKSLSRPVALIVSMVCMPADGGAHQLGAIHQQALAEIDPSPRDPAERRHVQQRNRNADRRQQGVVRRASTARRRRSRSRFESGVRQITRQQPRDPVVDPDPSADLAGVALGEELDRQAQHVPEEAARHADRPAAPPAASRQCCCRPVSSGTQARCQRHAAPAAARSSPWPPTRIRSTKTRVKAGVSSPSATRPRPASDEVRHGTDGARQPPRQRARSGSASRPPR